MAEAEMRTTGPWVRPGLFVGLVVLVIGGLAAAGGGFSLPSMFVGFAMIALVLALSAVWQSVRAALGGGPDVGVGLDAGMAEREALLAEKESLLTTIKDITFDHEVGKIDDEDFRRMNRAYRSRAKEVLRQLDQDLGPYLDEASKLVDGAMGAKGRPVGQGKKSRRKKSLECAACGAANDADALHCDQCGARFGGAECPSCGTENDPDAKFCKQCATPMKAKKKSPSEKTQSQKTQSEKAQSKKSGAKKPKKRKKPAVEPDQATQPEEPEELDEGSSDPEPPAADAARAEDAAAPDGDAADGDAPDSDAPDDDADAETEARA